MKLYAMQATHVESNVQPKLAHNIYKMTPKGQLFQVKQPRLQMNTVLLSDEKCSYPNSTIESYSNNFHCALPKIWACHLRENGGRMRKKYISLQGRQ